MRDVADNEVDTVTNRQAILAYVTRMRAAGEWPSAYRAAHMLLGVEPSAESYPMLKPFIAAVTRLCRQMTVEGLLTFSSHGYLGIGGQPGSPV